MAEPVRHLHPVDDAGEIIEGAPEVVALKRKVAELEDELEGARSGWSAAKGAATRLKRQLANMRFVAPETEDVREVLEFHRRMLMPDAKISEQSARWGVVSDLLKLKKDQSDEPLFSVLELTAAVAGMALQSYVMDPDHLYRRDLTTAFCSRRNGGPSLPDPGRVERHISEAKQFRRETGTSALELLDDLADHRLAWLADRCSCGDLRVAHLMARVECVEFDEFNAGVERWKREQDEQARRRMG